MIEVKKSEIHGWGVFSLQAMKRGTLIPVLQEGYVGYCKFKGFNRSCNPNGWMNPLNDEVYLVRNIDAGEEITLGYPVKKCKCNSCRV